MNQQPTLAKWLPGHRAAAIRDAVAKAIERENPELATGAITAELEVERISLGARYFDERPWTRRMTAGDTPDISFVRQGIYPGQTHTVNYTVYRLEVTSGAEMVAVGANGGPALDPTFVRLEGNEIVVRAADDSHRDWLIRAIEDHVERANHVIDEWNTSRLPQAVSKELKAQLRSRKRESARASALKAAGFSPSPTPAEQRSDPRRGRVESPIGARLTDEEFLGVLTCLAKYRDSVETDPGAGADPGAPEPDHRDWLNTALRMCGYDATPETESRGFPVDVHARAGELTRFLAECKIWNGVASLDQAMGQLTQRLTYRDRHGGVVMFVRGRRYPQRLTAKAIAHLERHGAQQRPEVSGFPVLRVPRDGSTPYDLVLIFIVVDQTPPRS